MSVDAALTAEGRRRSIRCSYLNGGLWGAGNGLVSTTLVIYLARELGAEQIGLGVSFILAAPLLVGMLRLGGPALIGRMADRKRFCISLNGSRWVLGGADLAFPECVIHPTAPQNRPWVP